MTFPCRYHQQIEDRIRWLEIKVLVLSGIGGGVGSGLAVAGIGVAQALCN